MPRLWACYEPDLIQYHEDRAAALTVSGEDVTAFLGLMGENQKEEILSISDGVATIQIEGVLSQGGPDLWDRMFGLSGTSYVSITDAIIEANEDPDVERIELSMDTPGGEVNGVDTVYQAVSDSEKPIVAINTGLLASAGYWIASAADQIIAESAVVETGSIGVMVSGIDQSKRLEEMGVKVVDIVSENAPNKAPRIDTDEGVEEIRNRINAIERVFISRVAVGRNLEESSVRADFGRGSVLIANDPNAENIDALKAGMIDGVLYTPAERQANTQHTPVTVISDAGATIEGDYMAEDTNVKPEANEELDALRVKHDELSARVERAKPYLAGNDYPEAIKSIALKVMSGEVDPATLDGAVIAYDALKETKVADSAIVDSDAAPEANTKPIDAPKLSEDGVIRNELDYEAAIKKINLKSGIVR